MFNCQNCSKKLWFKYYKLPNSRIVCSECFDFYKTIKEIEKQVNKKKEIENQ